MAKSKKISIRFASRKHARGRNAGGRKPIPLKPLHQLTLADKLRTLADIVRCPLTLCFHDDGSLDVLRTRRKIPEHCLKKFDVTETTHVDAEGNKTVHHITEILLRDKLAALRLHGMLTAKSRRPNSQTQAS